MACTHWRLGHNGNLVNTPELAGLVGISGAATTDTDVVTTLIVNEMQVAGGLEEAAMRVLPSLTGAFCFVFMDERSVFAVRDPRGFRPLSIGRLPNGFVVASETCALDIVGATFVRDVEPGEMVRIDDRGLHSRRFAEAPRGALCVFEYVYLARPDSRLRGRTVHEARREMGRRLAIESPVEADMVIAVPTTSHSAAQGYSEVSGLPYGDGLYKNNYVGRTFIQPSQSLRDLGVKLKLNPLPDSIRGKRLVVVDDSIIRGTTTKQVVADAPRGRSRRGAHPHHLPADPVAVLLRHRHAHPTGADRRRPHGRADPCLRRRRLARLPVAGGDGRGRGGRR